MPKATRTLSGAARDKYFRDLFAAEAELPKAAADRLTRLCTREIAQLRVREPIPYRPPATRKEPPPQPPQPQPPVSGSKAETGKAASAKDAPSFDPYAFSLVTTFRRSGRDALLARLNEIDSAANLRKLAEAQHVALPADVTEPAQMREAIIDGTEQRLADRRAAAS